MSEVRSRLTFSNVVACLALFVALGGSAYAVAVNSVGTKQLKDKAVTTRKLADSAVTTGKLANNAVTTGKLANNAVTTRKLANNSVTSAKVVDHTLTATDVAPNTFLAANGTAADSARLGGLLPGDFVEGVGFMNYRRIVVAKGASGQLLNSLFGTWRGNCDATGHVSVTWSPIVTNAEYLAQALTTNGLTVDTLNEIPSGGSANEPAAPSLVPVAITYQIGYTSGLDHMVTAFITGRNEGASCVFTG
ncbi:MAG: hypothetical protein ACJ764_08795, partial [Solirubrobacteraceae bacterium]